MGDVFKVVGNVVSMGQAYKQGREEKKAAYYQADQMDQQAKGEVAAASINADRLGQKVKAYLASQRAKSAAGGQSSNDATSIALRAETVKNASLDQLMVMAEAEERARQLRNDAYQTRLSGRNAAQAGGLKAFSSALDAAGTIASSTAMPWNKTYGSTSTAGGHAGGHS